MILKNSHISFYPAHKCYDITFKSCQTERFVSPSHVLKTTQVLYMLFEEFFLGLGLVQAVVPSPFPSSQGLESLHQVAMLLETLYHLLQLLLPSLNRPKPTQQTETIAFHPRLQRP